MKTPSTFLFDLVKSLTKSEKRYIKVRAGDGEKDYLQLMDAIIAQQAFDEEQFIRDNEGANFLKHLAVSKKYLYDLLLKSLTQYQQTRLEDQVFEKINAANVLIEKGLFVAALRELKKGQKIAQQFEFFELQILLFGIEKRLLSERQLKNQDDPVIHRVFQGEMESLAQLKNTTVLHFTT